MSVESREKSTDEKMFAKNKGIGKWEKSFMSTLAIEIGHCSSM